jgi:sulfite exporter TauE/SafE
MLSSIHPFGERSRNNRYGLTVAFYVAGAVAGGAAAGALFGMLGEGVDRLLGIGRTTAVVLAALVALIGLAFDLRLGGLRLPSIHRQVNEDWLTAYRSWVYGGGWGFQLGFGLMTIVPSASIYAMFAVIVLSGSLPFGAAIGALFGLLRASMIFSMATVVSPEQLRAAHRALQRRAVDAHRVAVGGLATAAFILGGGALWR